MSVVIFGAEKGGVGKTSLALNFALMAAERGVDAVLLDTDRQKTASNWAALRTEDPRLPHLSVLAHSADPLKEIASLAGRYSLVVVDIGAGNYKTLLDCVLLSDAYLIPTSTSGLDLDSAEDMYHLVSKLARQAKGNKPAVRVLLNKVPSHPNSLEVSRTRARLDEANVQTLAATLANRSVWRSMANSGRSLFELSGKNGDPRARLEMGEVFEEVAGLLGRRSKK